MQQLKQLYRSNYAGENIVSQLTLTGGEWNPETEFVPNQVFSTHTTSQAVAIGNGESRASFDLQLIGDHRGGLFAADKLQTYGCNALYRDFAIDFLVATGDDIIDEIANSGYTNDNIVYANADAVLKHPGKFYLIPQNIPYDAGSLAAYLACFDGHKKIFLIGYDGYDNFHHELGGNVNNIYKGSNGYLDHKEEQNGQFLSMSLANVVKTYSDVEFIRVMPESTHWIPSNLEPLLNFRQISYNDFRFEADLGAIGAPGF
jgi:hypothetical protein